MEHPTDYNKIAEEYKRSKFQPWRIHSERHMLMKLLGDLRGRSVLDLACGEGFYSRQLKLSGAQHTLGVDLSSQMIELARQQEKREPLGIEYLVSDASEVELKNPVDLILAAYLINYAQNQSELSKMAKAMAKNLKAGGRVVMVNNNVLQEPATWSLTRPYGFVKKGSGKKNEGEAITFEFYLDDGKIFSLDNYYIAAEVQEKILKEAGFQKITWHMPEIDEPGLKQYGTEHWSDFLKASPVIFTECIL